VSWQDLPELDLISFHSLRWAAIAISIDHKITLKMRPAVRLFAAIKPRGLIEPGAPTGLTGLLTHPSPRSTLIYLYSNTLEKLKEVPETSVYRQATEALTKKRLSIIEAVKPPGYDSWLEKMQYKIAGLLAAERGHTDTQNGKTFYHTQMWRNEKDERIQEWDGEPIIQLVEGPASAEVKERAWKKGVDALFEHSARLPHIEPEPLLTYNQ
jgi:NADH dehydrogenase (ubiquinone) 1 alpha subcomplex subunit 5